MRNVSYYISSAAVNSGHMFKTCIQLRFLVENKVDSDRSKIFYPFILFISKLMPLLKALNLRGQQQFMFRYKPFYFKSGNHKLY